ncbi:MAG: NrsF family protein [Polyangiaceae bacterium]
MSAPSRPALPDGLEPDDLDAEFSEMDDLPWSELGRAEASHGPCSKVSAKIRAECTRDLCPSKNLSVRSRLFISVFFSMGLMGALVVLFGHHAEPPAALRTALWGAVGWGVVMLSVLVVGFAKPPGKRGSVRLRTALAFGLPIAFFGYLLLTGQPGESLGDFVSHGSSTWRATECGFFSLAIGGLSSAGVLFAWRRTDPLTPRLSGALAGLVGGLGAALAVGMACPTTDKLHLLFSHGIVVIAFTVLGALAGRRLMTP